MTVKILKSNMRGKLTSYLLTVLIMSLACSCSNTTSTNLSIGTTEFNTDLPAIDNLKLIDTVDCEVYGMRSIKIVDSLLFISTIPSWTAVSINDKKPIAEFFSMGQGPGEFYYIPRAAEGYFFNKNDSLYVYAPDHNNNRILELNVTKALSHEPFEVIPAINTPEINNSCWVTIPCGEDKVFLSRANGSFTGFRRFIVSNDSVFNLPLTQAADELTVNDSGDINILSKVTRFCPASGKIVEFMLYLNQINVFSIDGSWGKTICVGKKLDNVKTIEQQDMFLRTDTYTSGSVWPQGFGGIYSGYTEKEIQKSLTEKNKIQFFDWDGKGICEVELPFEVLAFDLDFENGILYVIKKDEDMLLRYDASEVVGLY